MKRAILLVLLCLLPAACNDMGRQPRSDSDEPSKLFADGKALQAPPEGTLARDDPARMAALQNRPPLTPALLQRGAERYAIYCTPCHGLTGDGHGRIPSRGFPQPPSFHEARLKAAPSRHFVDVITACYGAMYSYSDRIDPHDRWAIAAYIRALQISQSMPASALDEDERRRLEESGS